MSISKGAQDGTQAIYELLPIARKRWGNVPTTFEMLAWDTGGWRATVYHTIDSQSDEYQFLRVRVRARSGDDKIRETVVCKQYSERFDADVLVKLQEKEVFLE